MKSSKPGVSVEANIKAIHTQPCHVIVVEGKTMPQLTVSLKMQYVIHVKREATSHQFVVGGKEMTP